MAAELERFIFDLIQQMPRLNIRSSSPVALGAVVRLTEHFAIRCGGGPTFAPGRNMVGFHLFHSPYLTFVGVMAYRAE